MAHWRMSLVFHIMRNLFLFFFFIFFFSVSIIRTHTDAATRSVPELTQAITWRAKNESSHQAALYCDTSCASENEWMSHTHVEWRVINVNLSEQHGRCGNYLSIDAQFYAVHLIRIQGRKTRPLRNGERVPVVQHSLYCSLLTLKLLRRYPIPSWAKNIWHLTYSM